MNRRTSLITSAAVAGTLLAGTGAIAANIGVLRSADDDSIGNLSADAEVETPPATVEAQVIDIYIEDPPTTSPTVVSTSVSTTVADDPAGVAQQFAVEGVGTVTVEQTSTGLTVGDVQANEGWTWSTGQSDGGDLTVTLTSGETTYGFHAAVGADGLIEARVDQPIVNVVQTPAAAPASSATSGSGGDYDDEYDDHDEYEYEDEDDDHEGGDDDD